MIQTGYGGLAKTGMWGSCYAYRASTCDRRTFTEILQLHGYSAHADQQDLLSFVEGMAQAPGQIRLVHGDEGAEWALKQLLVSKGFHTVIAS